MKKLLIILMLALPTFVGAQSYSDITGRINAGIWQDGSRFQMNTYRRLVIDTLNSLMIGLADYSKNEFLPLTLGGNTSISGAFSLSIGPTSVLIPNTLSVSGPVSFQRVDFPLIHTVSFSPGYIFFSATNGAPAKTANILLDVRDTAHVFQFQGTAASYQFDYATAMTTDRHIPDIGWIKGYVDTAAAAGSSYTFENGLTEASGAVKLGGEYTANTTVHGGNGNRNFIISTASSGTPLARLLVQKSASAYAAQLQTLPSSGFAAIVGTDTTTTLGSRAFMRKITGVNIEKAIYLTDSEMRVLDQADSVGLIYAADYSANFTARSLVDKGYVDARAKLGKYDATAAPGTGDDAADGYSVGSMWIDVTNDDAYICVDSTNGAAVWKKITP